MRRLTVLALGCAAATGVAGETGDVARLLQPGHPRLLLTDERLAELRTAAQSDPTLGRWTTQVLGRCEGTLRAKPRDYQLIGPRLLHVSRDYLNRILDLGFGWRWTRDRRYAEAAREFLFKACSFKDWHPDHFLDTAEMTCAIGLGYDWFHDALDAAARRRIEEALVRLGLEPGLACYAGTAKYGWWVRANHNWNQVCNGGLLVGALAIGDVRPDILSTVVASARASLPRALAEYAPDGNWGEGPGYWGYATMYTAFGLDAMRTALGTDFGLSRTPGLSKAAAVPMWLAGPTGLYFNYADCGERSRRGPCSEMMWLARTFGDAGAAADEHGIVARNRPDARHVIWYVPPPPERAGRPLDALLRGPVPVAVFRSQWNDPGAVWVAVKGGYNAVNHAHLDLGSFVLDALGERWVVDLGSDDYNLPGYFGNKRWSYYRLNGSSHAIPLIGGRDQDPKGRAEMAGFHSGDSGGQAILDLTRAYPAGVLESYRRGVALTRQRRAVVVQDEFKLPAPADIVWGFTTYARIEIAEPRLALLSQGGREVRVRILAPGTASFSAASAERRPPEKTNKGARRLEIRLPAGDVAPRIGVLFAPVGPRGAADEDAPLIPLSQWR